MDINQGNVNTNQVNNYRDNEIKGNERRGRGLFYGVVAIATLIIMGVGATFAYFAATAASANTSITTGSTSLSLELISYESAWMKGDLIPADGYIARYAFANQNDTTLGIASTTEVCYNENDEEVDCSSDEVVDEKTVTKNTYRDKENNTLCVDDDGNQVCSVYVFQIVNDNPSEQTMTFSVISQYNTFKHLHAMAYEVKIVDTDVYGAVDAEGENKLLNGDSDPNLGIGDGKINVLSGSKILEDGEYTPVYVNRAGVTKTLLTYSTGGSTTPSDGALLDVTAGAGPENVSTRTTTIANQVKIAGGATGTYAIVLYIDNMLAPQPEDENGSFIGSVTVVTGDGTSGVSGRIEAAGTVDDNG